MGKETIPNGCSFGRETRVMVSSIHESVNKIERSVVLEGEKIDKLVSGQNRKPSWLVTAAMAFLCSLCCGLIVYVLTHETPVSALPIATEISP